MYCFGIKVFISMLCFLSGLHPKEKKKKNKRPELQILIIYIKGIPSNQLFLKIVFVTGDTKADYK